MKFYWGWFENDEEMKQMLPSIADWCIAPGWYDRPSTLDNELDETTVADTKIKIEDAHTFLYECFYFEMMVENFRDVYHAISDFEKESNDSSDSKPYIRKIQRLFINVLGSMYT